MSCMSSDYKHLGRRADEARSLLSRLRLSTGIYFTRDLFELMRGKRRDPRFALTVPWEGSLRVPDDVIVERCNDSEVWVVSTSPARVDEVMTLDVTGSGSPVTMNVRVVESVPVLIEGVVRHGLRLVIL